jgi:hypothetical protein
MMSQHAPVDLALIADRPPWLARVRAGPMIGAGILINETHVITCAHVVHGKRVPVDAIVLVDFPFVTNRRVIQVTTRVVSPESDDDVALLELFAIHKANEEADSDPPVDTLAPVGTAPAPFGAADRSSGAGYRAYGYPSRGGLGGWSYGRVGGLIAGGRLQLDRDPNRGYPIVPGFSGSPIWNDSKQRVIGMVVARDRDPGEDISVGFGISTECLFGVFLSIGIRLESPAHSQITVQPVNPSELPAVSTTQLGSEVDLGRYALASLFNGDPTISLPVADHFSTASNDEIGDVVNKIGGKAVTLKALRTALSKKPDVSGPLMVAKVLDADRNWHGATLVPDCFSVEHQPYCTDQLLMGLECDEPDVVRKCIESLGYIGATRCAVKLKKLFDSSSEYEFDKYNSYLLAAMARFFVQEEDNFNIESRLTVLKSMIRRLVENGRADQSLGEAEEIMALSRPCHADSLVRDWLEADMPILRRLALRALGGMRLRRAIPYIAARLRDPHEDLPVRSSAAMALANIGTAEAFGLLFAAWESDPDGSIRNNRQWQYALMWALSDARTDRQLKSVALRFLSSEYKGPSAGRLWIYRAIGLRRLDSMVGLVRDGLSDRGDAERAQAALAFARLAPVDAREELPRSYQEAASDLERVCINLALRLIGIDGHDQGYSQLRSDLATGAWRYARPLREDLLTLLRSFRESTSTALADCWARVFEGLPDY